MKRKQNILAAFLALALALALTACGSDGRDGSSPKVSDTAAGAAAESGKAGASGPAEETGTTGASEASGAAASESEDGTGDAVTRFAEADGSNAERGSISIPGYETLDFVSGSEDQKVWLYNPAENNCLFRMRLVSGSGGETLWQGEDLAPGMAYTRITLTRALEPGQYPATLLYECFTLEGGQPLNGAEIKVTLIVA